MVKGDIDSVLQFAGGVIVGGLALYGLGFSDEKEATPVTYHKPAAPNSRDAQRTALLLEQQRQRASGKPASPTKRSSKKKHTKKAAPIVKEEPVHEEEDERPSWMSNKDPQVTEWDTQSQEDTADETASTTSTNSSASDGVIVPSPTRKLTINRAIEQEIQAVQELIEEQDEEEYLPSWASTKEPCTPVPQASGRASTPIAARFIASTPTSSSLEATVSSAQKAVGDVAFALSDAVFVYPVVNDNYAGQHLEARADARERNASGHKVQVRVLQTRAGAGGAVVGALTAGSTTSVVAASKSLRLMLPSLFQMSSENLPGVLHVAAYSVDDSNLALGQSLEDIALVRDSGAALLASATAQEAHDLAIVAHLAAHASSSPFIHFFDGVRTMNQHQHINIAPADALAGAARAVKRSHTASPTSRAGFAAAADDSCPLVATEVDRVFAQLTKLFGRRYRIFDYHGDAEADSVVIAMGSPASTVTEVVERLGEGSKVGVLVIRLMRPWSSAHMLAALPKSVRRVCVLDQAGHLRPLFQDVAAAFHSNANWVTPLLVGGSILSGPDADGFSPAHALSVIDNLRTDSPVPNFTICDRGSLAGLPVAKLPTWRSAPGAKEIVIYSADASTVASHALTKALSSGEEGMHVQQVSQRDSLLGDDGLSRHDLRFGPFADSVASEHAISSADVVVADIAALQSKHNIVSVSKERSTLVLLVAGGAAKLVEDSANLLPRHVRATVMRKGMTVKVLDVTDAEEHGHGAATWMSTIAALYAAGQSDPAPRGVIEQAFRHHLITVGKVTRGLESIVSLLSQVQHATESVDLRRLEGNLIGMQNVTGGEQWDTQSLVSGVASGDVLQFVARAIVSAPGRAAASTAVTVAAAPSSSDGPRAVKKHELAWNVIFKDSYKTEKALRPSEHNVHQVRLTSRKRLTPDDYDRNVFHLEFDITGTGMTYEIGDALGVYGHNDEVAVDEFLKEMEWDGNEVVAMPARGGMSEGTTELVSLRNLLVQYVDVFGRPGKKFYVALAQHAQRRYEYLFLMHTGTDDPEMFKLGIHEAVNYADLMLRYRSAKPTPAEFVAMVPAIKPRHYSIASSNNLNPRSVHLLVVAVDWKTPMGKTRTGQCTRYLANLAPNSLVTVDIMSSILRLPPTPQQPIVMAGLGTGMAPFRAFIQERKFQKESGIEVGPVVLYFGARYRAEEYLYGDELDAYAEEGLVTRLGLAFSRDQKQKVYIQHKIEEDGPLLKKLLGEQKGSFYLCGPTWPVPDVRDAIAKGMTPELNVGKDIIDTEVVENLKAEGRYVLEVY